MISLCYSIYRKREKETVFQGGYIMVRTFINSEMGDFANVRQVDMETGKIRQYVISVEMDFPFSFKDTSFSEMGYETVGNCIKGLKRKRYKEVQTDRQKAKEVSGILKLAKYRNEHGIHYNDMVEYLKDYMDGEEAKRRIDYYINHGIERHLVRVTLSDGNVIETFANGSIEEIENYYSKGAVFNIGSVDDEIQTISNLDFIS
jgi:hypothetical protein